MVLLTVSQREVHERVETFKFRTASESDETFGSPQKIKSKECLPSQKKNLSNLIPGYEAYYFGKLFKKNDKFPKAQHTQLWFKTNCNQKFARKEEDCC